MSDHATSTSRVRVESVSPEPDPAVLAAIEQALSEVWPVPAAPWSIDDEAERWRFSQRPWRHRSIPRNGWGR